MSVRVPGTHHTRFAVSGLDRTPGFFRDGPGVQVISRAPRDPAVASKATGVGRGRK